MWSLLFLLMSGLSMAEEGPKCGPVECQTSGSGLHLLFGQAVPFNLAAQQCAQFGYQLADITAQNSMWAQSIVSECIGQQGQAWVQSFNGLTGEPCMVVEGFGVVGVADCWSDPTTPRLLPVLCQEVTVVTETTVLVSTWSVTQGEATETATTSVWPPKPTRKPHFKPDSDVEDFRLKAAEVKDKNCPSGQCDNVCPFQYPTLRVLRTDHVSYSEADEQCRKHGWRLASVTTGSFEKVLDLISLCSEDSRKEDIIVWARSYNGVASITCNMIADQVFTFGLSNSVCGNIYEEAITWILCRTEGPVSPADQYGGWKAHNTTTTVSTSTTSMLLIPSTTITVTKTETIRCRKGDPCYHH